MRARFGYVIGRSLIFFGLVLSLAAGCSPRDVKINVPANAGDGKTGDGGQTQDPYRDYAVVDRDPELAAYNVLQVAHVFRELDIALGFNHDSRHSMEVDTPALDLSNCMKIARPAPGFTRPSTDESNIEVLKKSFVGCQLKKKTASGFDGNVEGEIDYEIAYTKPLPRKEPIGDNSLGYATSIRIFNNAPLKISVVAPRDKITVERYLVIVANLVSETDGDATYILSEATVTNKFSQPATGRNEGKMFRDGTVVTTLTGFTFTMSKYKPRHISAIVAGNVSTKISGEMYMTRDAGKFEISTDVALQPATSLQIADSICAVPTGSFTMQKSVTSRDQTREPMVAAFDVIDQVLKFKKNEVEVSIPTRLCEGESGDITLAEELGSVVFK